MKQPVLAAFALAAIASFSSSQAAPAHSFIDLGSLGANTSYALDVNNLGWVTGSAGSSGFVYSGGGLLNMGVLPDGNGSSRGHALNDLGVVVGESNGDSARAFVYANGQMRGLTRLAGDNDLGSAHGINNAGVIVGRSSNGQAVRPTQWINGVASDLGSLDGLNTSAGQARGISDNGLVVGVSARSGGPAQATLWNWWHAGGQPFNLGSLYDNTASEAFAVNSSAYAVGYAVSGSTANGTEIRRAVIWEPHADHYHIDELGSLGLAFSEARDINTAGQIVGFASNLAGTPQSAFLWQDGTMHDLNALYGSTFNFSFSTAEGINDRGDIVGWGIAADGSTHAYLLSAVPEPASWGLMGLGLAGLAALQARRARAAR